MRPGRKVGRRISGNGRFRQFLHRQGKLFLQGVDAHVPRDGKEPGRKLAARRIERGQFLKGRDKNVLADFFTTVAVPYESSYHAENGSLIPLHEDSEGIYVSIQDTFNSVRIFRHSGCDIADHFYEGYTDNE